MSVQRGLTLVIALDPHQLNVLTLKEDTGVHVTITLGTFSTPVSTLVKVYSNLLRYGMI